ncbi:MAG: glycosyl transferase family protein, partial [Candidatus Woesebacteria bacterium GW2011_GWF1_40_24]
KWGLLKATKYLLTGLFVFILGFIPFTQGNLPQFVLTRLNISAGQYPYTSVNAFNFWGLSGFWKPDNVYFQFSGYIMIIAATIILCIRRAKKKLSPYFLITFVFAASFMFFTRMHERHLLPVFAPLAIAVVDNPIFLLPYIGFSLIYVMNLVYSHFWVSNKKHHGKKHFC